MKGEPVQAYNISNPGSIVTIRQMAEAIAKAGNVELVTESASEREKQSFNLMDNSSLDSIAIQELGWKGFFDINTGAVCTIQIIKESMQ